MNNFRLQSLDTLRGLDMFFIMGLSGLIVSLCALWPNSFTNEVAMQMRHVAWNGLHHHDTIFPLFLFLAGVSFPFSLAKQRESGATTADIYFKIGRRTLMLILLGVVYNGLFELDFAHLRIASVLARIALAWCGAAVLYINFGVKSRVWIAVAILVGYALLSRFVGAPDMPGADALSMEGSLAGWLDRQLLPGYLIYGGGRFDPEGLLSTLPAVVTAMLGVFAGELILLPNEQLSGSCKTLYMIVGAVALAILAYVGSFVVPINKMLWSSSFVCAVGSYSLAMMAIIYYVVDVRGWQRWTLPFRVVGLNSITIYMAQEIISFRAIDDFFLGGVASLFPEQIGAVILNAGYVLVCWLFLYFLYKQQIFLKI